MTTTAAILYGLIQSANPDLTVPFDEITFGTPAPATLDQANAFNRNASVSISAENLGNPVPIYYNRVPLNETLLTPLVGSSSNIYPVYMFPQGTYSTTADFATYLSGQGLPVTPDDVVSVAVPTYWSGLEGSYEYSSFALQLLQWNNSLGFTGTFWAMYGPAEPAALATAFPSQYYSVAGVQIGDPAQALTNYTNFQLSGEQQQFGATVTRMSTQYSNLTVLDEATSAEFGGAEVSCTVTAAANPAYPFVNYFANVPTPYFPFYTGSQTVYYTQLDLTNTTQVVNQFLTGFWVADQSAPQPLIPLGNMLGTSIVTSVDLVKWLYAQERPYSLGGLWDWTDIVEETLPPYGEDGTVVYNLTFQNSYSIKNGSLPLTLSQTGPDMSAMASTTVFPASNGALFAQNFFNPTTFQVPASGDISTIMLYFWATSYFESNDASNWADSCTAAIVEGSVQPTTSEQASANQGCAWTATIEVTAPWGATFQQVIFYDKLDISQCFNGSTPTAVDGTVTLFVDSVSFSLPMRVIDWIASPSLSYEVGSDNGMQISGNSQVAFLNSSLIYPEFANLTDLTYMDDNGDISFTLTAPEGSTMQTGTLNVVIKEDNTLPTLNLALLPESGSYLDAGSSPSPL